MLCLHQIDVFIDHEKNLYWSSDYGSLLLQIIVHRGNYPPGLCEV